jgi:lysophospholipase L1-like esterase
MRDQFQQIPFGVNEVRLTARQWGLAGLLITLIVLLTPRVWTRIERFDTGPDYRVPYQLSRDYWLYERWLDRVTDPRQVVVLGDSVVWGEYVLPNGTLSHFLNQQAGQQNRFVNGGVNGLFPLALEGLVRYYGGALRDRKIILHWNVLWLSSAKADLSTAKEEPFNHPQLVPQFFPRIPCYKAPAADRFNNVIVRESDFLAWVDHLQNACLGGKNMLSWTLADDGGDPPRYPNSYKNPFAQINLTVPSAPATDSQRGPRSPRHKPWTASGQGPQSFEWVPLDASLQWGAFERLVKLLRDRHNRVLVVIGPFNEHMVATDNLPAYWQIRSRVIAWLEREQVAHLAPDLLPGELYADASHPLTAGYALLAKRIYDNKEFQRWLNE